LLRSGGLGGESGRQRDCDDPYTDTNTDTEARHIDSFVSLSAGSAKKMSPAD
jgi:hypothetical protein